MFTFLLQNAVYFSQLTVYTVRRQTEKFPTFQPTFNYFVLLILNNKHLRKPFYLGRTTLFQFSYCQADIFNDQITEVQAHEVFEHFLFGIDYLLFFFFFFFFPVLELMWLSASH
jgi:hypothetical protein